MALVDEIVKRLAKVPAESGPAATAAQKGESLNRAKRGDTTYQQGGVPAVPAALDCYVEALDIDPGCKSAYEGIARIVIGKASTEVAAVEAALRFLDAGAKRLPGDAAIADYQKKLRELVPQKAQPQRTSSGRLPAQPKRAEKSTRNCEYCGSPIPAGSEQCMSCQMSGEVMRPKAPEQPGILERIVTRLFFKKD
jgi:hypothetical protein